MARWWSDAGWWSDVVAVVTSMPRAIRTGSRFGRIFRLRDRGHLEEALAAAKELADELLTRARFMDKPSGIIAASTVDELALRVGRPEEARPVLERALRVIAQEQSDARDRTRSADYDRTLDTYARRFQERLGHRDV
jgi:hypothetical protein